MKWLKNKTLVAAWLLLLFLGAAEFCLAATEEETAEYNIKAAFLYQFVNYIEWPADRFIDESSPIVFGVLNSDLLAGLLESLAMERSAKGRAVEIRRLEADDPILDLHVLFVGREEGNTAEILLMDASSMSVLTVTEAEPDRPSGSIINFEIVDDRVRFDIALSPAAQGNLRISSRLLQVAQRVIN